MGIETGHPTPGMWALGSSLWPTFRGLTEDMLGLMSSFAAPSTCPDVGHETLLSLQSKEKNIKEERQKEIGACDWGPTVTWGTEPAGCLI